MKMMAHVGAEGCGDGDGEWRSRHDRHRSVLMTGGDRDWKAPLRGYSP